MANLQFERSVLWDYSSQAGFPSLLQCRNSGRAFASTTRRGTSFVANCVPLSLAEKAIKREQPHHLLAAVSSIRRWSDKPFLLALLDDSPKLLGLKQDPPIDPDGVQSPTGDELSDCPG